MFGLYTYYFTNFIFLNICHELQYLFASWAAIITIILIFFYASWFFSETLSLYKWVTLLTYRISLLIVMFFSLIKCCFVLSLCFYCLLSVQWWVKIINNHTHLVFFPTRLLECFILDYYCQLARWRQCSFYSVRIEMNTQTFTSSCVTIPLINVFSSVCKWRYYPKKST